jgi:hypothetical protein
MGGEPKLYSPAPNCLTARLDDPGIGLNQIQTLSAALSKLGATPVDSSKVAALAPVEDDPAGRFFGGTH